MRNGAKYLSYGIGAVGTLAYAGVFATAWSRGYKGYNLGSAAILIFSVVGQRYPISIIASVVGRRYQISIFKVLGAPSQYLLLNPVMKQGVVAVCGLQKDSFSGVLATLFSVHNIKSFIDKPWSLIRLLNVAANAAIQANVPYLNEWSWGSKIASSMTCQLVACATGSLKDYYNFGTIMWRPKANAIVNTFLYVASYEALGVVIDKMLSPYEKPIVNSIARICILNLVWNVEQKYVAPQVERCI